MISLIKFDTVSLIAGPVLKVAKIFPGVLLRFVVRFELQPNQNPDPA